MSRRPNAYVDKTCEAGIKKCYHMEIRKQEGEQKMARVKTARITRKKHKKY